MWGDIVALKDSLAISNEFMTVVKGDSVRNNVLTLRDSIEDNMDTYIKIANDSKPMHAKYTPTRVTDEYNNSVAGAGDFDVQRSFTNYGFSNDTMNWALWLTLYNDSWVFRRAIDKPAQDEVNCGFTLNGSQDYDKVYKSYNKCKNKMIELLMWGALFGGSIGVLMFDGISDEELGKPINKEKIKGKSFKVYTSDRWYGVGVSNEDTVSNMKDIDFGKPRMYNITFADGRSVNVHHSWVLRYEHRVAPNLVKNGQLQGWGYAEGAHILNELSRDDQLKAAIQTLVNKSLIEVIKMTGMRGVFMGTDSENEEQLKKRLEMVNWGRSYNSLTFLDKDDDYQQNTFGGLQGLSDILEKNMWLISAALEMQGVLYGDLRGGFSQAADDMKRYATTIKNRCNAYYRPVLNKLLKILFIVHDVKGNVDFEFNSINQKEENNEKIESIGKFAETLRNLSQDGLISKYQMARSLNDFIQKDIVSIMFSEEQMNRLKYEEENDILSAYKKLGKNAPASSNPTEGEFGGGDFGGGESSDFDLDSELGLNETEETPTEGGSTEVEASGGETGE